MAVEDLPQDSRYNALFTNPRTASHLLTRLLNLQNQSSIHRHPDDGYIFMRPTMMRLKRGLGGIPISNWTAHDNKTVKFAFQKSYNELMQWKKTAQIMEKGAYLKFHCLELIEPVSETRWLHGADNAGGMLPWTVSIGNGASGGGSGSAKSEGNETCFPDTVLKSWAPTFLIRHPALVLPSLLRADLDVGNDTLWYSEREAGNIGYKQAWEAAKRWQVSFHWQRQLLDWYSANLTEEEKRTSEEGISYPIVLDADDIQLNSAPKLVRKYARAVGLDPDVVKFGWNVASEQEMSQMNIYEKRLLNTISASTGIVPGKTAQGLVLEDEKVKWKKEFGEDLGAKLGLWVEDAMADYEWMRGVRLRA